MPSRYLAYARARRKTLRDNRRLLVDRPRSASSGPMRAMIGPGVEPTRRRSPMSTRPTARRRSRSRTLPDSRASFRSTVTPDIGRWRARAEAIPRGMARLLRLLPDSASPHEPRSVDPSKIAFVSLAAVGEWAQPFQRTAPPWRVTVPSSGCGRFTDGLLAYVRTPGGPSGPA